MAVIIVATLPPVSKERHRAICTGCNAVIEYDDADVQTLRFECGQRSCTRDHYNCGVLCPCGVMKTWGGNTH